MNSKIDFKIIAIIVGGLLFNFVFWEEELGLNTVIYSAFIFAALAFDKPQILKNRIWLLAALAHILTCVNVVYNNMPFSVLSYYATLFVMLACAHTENIKTVVIAGASTALQIIAAPISIFQKLTTIRIGGMSIKPIIKPIKYMVILIILLFVFGGLYTTANVSFGNYFESFFKSIEDIASKISKFLFADLSIGRFMFFIAGTIFTGGLLLKLKRNPIAKLDGNSATDLIRKRRSVKNRSFLRQLIGDVTGDLLEKKMALKVENTIGILCFACLNLLLLGLNLIEIGEIFGNNPSQNYASALHDGTNTLIFSILLAMIVILFFFNGNLNFYSKNQLIKSLAFAWIFQNLLLVIAVFHQDWIYVNALGLTHKRIGILIFASLTAIGLITVFIKVKYQKTFFYLVKINSFVWLCFLVASGFIHWDKQIISYNLANQQSIPLDYEYATSLSNHTLISIYEHRGLLANAKSRQLKSNQLNIQPNQTAAFIVKEELEDRIDRFMIAQEQLSFLSWNYDDWRTYNYFKNLNWKINTETTVR